MNPKTQISFLVFSDDWGEHPSSSQHIFKHILKTHQVLWVNTIGMRGMRLTRNDFKKALGKLRKMFFGAKKPSKVVSYERFSNLSVIQPFMLPFIRIPGVRIFNTLSVVRSVRKKMVFIGMREPVFVTTVPNACDFVGKFGERKKIYYCVDDFTLWPGLDHTLVLEMEKKLVEESDIFFTTSNALYDRLLKTGKPTMMLSHGVDIDHFSNLPEQEHPLLASIPSPRVGYFGLFDERSDQRFLSELAQKMPHISFVITGNVVTDISSLRQIQNIYFTGPVTYDELPAMVTGWTVCMLPYKVDSLSESINPLKIKEYIATAKPTICTPLSELMKFDKIISLKGNTSQWQAFIESHCNAGRKPDTNRTDIQKYLGTESWRKKAEWFCATIRESIPR